MTYSIDLRERVVDFVQAGGSKSEACRRFSVCRQTVYNWLLRDDLSPKPHGRRQRKLDWDALRQHVEQYPDLLLRERASHFGVHISSIAYALRQMRVTHKKSS